MDFYNFCTVINRRKRFRQIWQKCPPHLINVLTLPSENENITFHTFIMHSLNITRYIKLNDRPDGIIHRIEVWWVRWPHVWHYGLSFSNVCMRPEFMTSMSCDSVYCMCGVTLISRWLMTQLTNSKCACGLVFVRVADILNNLVTINLFSLYLMNFMFYTMLDAACNIQRMHYKSMKFDVFIFTR